MQSLGIYFVMVILMITAYVPTLVDVIILKKNNANLISYILGSCANALACYYSFFVINDGLLQIVSIIHLIACLSVMGFVCKNK